MAVEDHKPVNERLLAMMLDSVSMTTSPKSRMFHTKHYDLEVSIGNDHTATITVDEEALCILSERNDIDITLT